MRPSTNPDSLMAKGRARIPAKRVKRGEGGEEGEREGRGRGEGGEREGRGRGEGEEEGGEEGGERRRGEEEGRGRGEGGEREGRGGGERRRGEEEEEGGEKRGEKRREREEEERKEGKIPAPIALLHKLNTEPHTVPPMPIPSCLPLEKFFFEDKVYYLLLQYSE